MKAPSVESADRLARSVLRRRLAVKAGEAVTIEAYPSALPWATGFVREARRLGARPLLLYEDERSYWTAVSEGRTSLVGSPGANEWGALEGSDVYVYFWGPEDLPRRRSLPDREAEQLVAFNTRWYETARKAGVRGVRMGIARATEPNARFFGVPVTSWREKVYDASVRDPAAFRAAAARVARRLEKGRSVRIRHPNGTDLTLALAGRRPYVTLGEVTATSRKTAFGSMASVPDASVYVAVDESTADGTFVANRTSTAAFFRPVDGGRFRFRDGRLVGHAFGRGGAAFRNAFRAAGAGRDRPAFVEVGFDPSLAGVPLLEEAEAGAVTVGVGGNVGFGGRTKVDFLGYLTVGGAELTVDGRPLVRGGRVLGG
jgi:leucyl aminopeptidase (aminopeptidase T)